MSNRGSVRFIAKERLHAMGVPHVNKIMGMGLKHSKHRKLQRTSEGRKALTKLRKEHNPVWRRVTSGSLAKKGYEAQMGIGPRQKYRIAK